MKKDNSTLTAKVRLRQKAVQLLGGKPTVMETHGGAGIIWGYCYRLASGGVVFEKDPRKTEILAKQRQDWSVYEADCIAALRAGAGSHLEINLLDVDPYGDPWPVIEAFFSSDRPRADKLFVAVNDGLRQGLKMGRAWACESVKHLVPKYGNNLSPYYLQVCEELMREKAALANYTVSRFRGYYTGHAKQMTHYLAELHRL